MDARCAPLYTFSKAALCSGVFCFPFCLTGAPGAGADASVCGAGAAGASVSACCSICTISAPDDSMTSCARREGETPTSLRSSDGGASLLLGHCACERAIWPAKSSCWDLGSNQLLQLDLSSTLADSDHYPSGRSDCKRVAQATRYNSKARSLDVQSQTTVSWVLQGRSRTLDYPGLRRRL
jgi:hypothetical protein